MKRAIALAALLVFLVGTAAMATAPNVQWLYDNFNSYNDNKRLRDCAPNWMTPPEGAGSMNLILSTYSYGDKAKRFSLPPSPATAQSATLRPPATTRSRAPATLRHSTSEPRRATFFTTRIPQIPTMRRDGTTCR
jgi:hypothetical protein